MKKGILISIILIVIILLVLVITLGVSDYKHNELHDHSVEIEGNDMKLLSVQEIADLWNINSEVLLQKIILEFNLKGEYTVDSILEDIRAEYKFSPALIKDIAEKIKQEGITHE